MHISTFKTILRLKQAVVLIGVQKSLNHDNLLFTILAGCPQGGVLSPFLWNLVLNDLLARFGKDRSIQAFVLCTRLVKFLVSW